MGNKKAFEMISEHEMAKELDLLKQHRVDEFMKDRYTISDMTFLTGWSENYLRILEREGRIPKAMRDDTVRGIVPEGKKQPKGRRHWDEGGARAIICFAKQQRLSPMSH